MTTMVLPVEESLGSDHADVVVALRRPGEEFENITRGPGFANAHRYTF